MGRGTACAGWGTTCSSAWIIIWGTQLSERGTNEQLALPEPNPFIPTDLSVDKVEVAEVRGLACARRSP